MTKRQILDAVKSMAEEGAWQTDPLKKDRMLNRIIGWVQGVRDEMRGNGKH